MKEIKVKDPNKNGFFNLVEVGDFEYVNPILKMSEIIIKSTESLAYNLLMFAKENNKLTNTENVANPDYIISKVALQKGIEAWQEDYKKIMKQNLPEKIFDILEATEKKEQIKLLRGVSFTTEELMLFIFKAWENFGFTYSMYTSQHHHNGLDESLMPRFAYKEEDGDITTVGKTRLTDGAIKHAIEYRTVTIARFLDKGNIWHCFFYSYKSLKGKEKGWGGKPHIHYISHNWGLSREEVLSQLKNKNYKLPSSLPHIDYHSYKNHR